MKGFWGSLSGKYLIVGGALLASLAAYIAGEMSFTRHLQQESGKTNLAGRQRLLTMRIVFRAHEALEPYPRAMIDRHRQQLSLLCREYELALQGLRFGDSLRGLTPLHAEQKDTAALLDEIARRWRDSQEPILAGIAGGSAGSEDQVCGLCHQAYENHFARLDELVASLERETEREIRGVTLFRFLAIGFLGLLIVSVVFFVRRHLLRPVKELHAAALRIAEGDLDHAAVEVRTDDEVGDLGRTFNAMAGKLSLLFQEQTERLNELHVLNEISQAGAGSLSLDALLEAVLDALLGLEALALEKKAAIFLCDKKHRTLRLAAARNFNPEQLGLCATVPFGECLCGRAAESGELVSCTHAVEDTRHTKTYVGMQDHGHLVLPLISRDSQVGVLCLYLPRGVTIPARREQLCRALAGIIAVAIQNALNHRQVAMLAQSLDSSGDLIVITDQEGRIIHVNPESVRQLGYTLEELEGQPVTIVQSPDNPPGLGEEIYRRTLEGGWSGEVLNRRKDGRDYPAQLTTAPVRDADGNLIAMIGVARNVSSAKAAEARLKEYAEHLEEMVRARTADLETAKREAEAATQTKSEFLANMSHELRTPLNSILGFSEILRDGLAGEVSEPQKEYLNDVWESGSHLLKLINDILDISKIEAGKMELECGTVDFNALLGETLVLFREKATRHMIAIQSAAAEGLPMIDADERKIKQVLINLLTNALKFTPDGGKVGVEAAAEAGELRVTVWDTGIGIAAEDLDRLFQPFQQLESSLTKKHEGTGLGLHLCRKIVELHGGRIRVESTPGQGSRFTFTIPIAAAAGEEGVIQTLGEVRGS